VFLGVVREKVAALHPLLHACVLDERIVSKLRVLEKSPNHPTAAAAVRWLGDFSRTLIMTIAMSIMAKTAHQREISGFMSALIIAIIYGIRYSSVSSRDWEVMV